MKKYVFLIIVSLFVLRACSEKEKNIEKGTGYLALNIDRSRELKTDLQIEEFTLLISTESGTVVVSEKIKNLPEQIALPVDRYTVRIFSVDFLEPKFDLPCYSGETEIEIIAGQTQNVSLICTQSNAGIKVLWSPEFAERYQTYQAELFSGTERLVYSASETRTGYFLPGKVEVYIHADGRQMYGGVIALNAGDLVNLSLRPVENLSGMLSIQITVDETANTRDVEMILEPSAANSQENPYSVAEAITLTEDGVWVEGYIVGSKPSASWDFTDSDLWQSSNIIVADATTETDRTKCMPVELGAASSTVRINLNLSDNPGNLGKKIIIKGDLKTYYSQPGLRNISAWSFQ
jgi:hypothetical protein